VTVGRLGVVVVEEAVVAAIILAAGAEVVSSVFDSAFLVAALNVSVVSVLTSGCAAVTVSAVDDFCLPSVSDAGSVAGVGSVVGDVVPEVVSPGVGFSVVGSVVGCVDVVLDELVVVPEPPEALTEDVGPSPDVVVVV
jgi:hypothetical protein